MTGVLMVVTAEAFNGERVLENTVRLVTMLVGMPIALLCLKFGLQALRKGQPDRAWGTLSYAFMLLVPAVGRAMSFGMPINWVTTGIYVAGLITAIIALFYRARWEGWWTKLAQRLRARQARRAQEKNDDR
jgi:peptidoglycan/LPS O-acetylase OafA/YrhL